MKKMNERALYSATYAWNKACLNEFVNFFPDNTFPQKGEWVDRALLVFNGVVFGTGITVPLLYENFPEELEGIHYSELESAVKLTTAFIEV